MILQLHVQIREALKMQIHSQSLLQVSSKNKVDNLTRLNRRHTTKDFASMGTKTKCKICGDEV